MSIVSVPTSFNIDLEFDVPSLGRRAVALFIDMFVQYLYLILINYMISAASIDSDLWAIWLIAMCPVFLYHILLELTTNGQSVGKKLMHLRVVSRKGGRPSLSQLLIRWILRVSDLWIVIIIYLLIYFAVGGGGVEAAIAVFFGLGFLVTDVILVANASRAQRIGDILAQTIVIKTSKSESLNNTIFREIEKGYVAKFPEVMRISDRDLNAIKNILTGSNRSKKQEAIDSAANKVKDYLQIETNMESKAFLDQLLTDYNYLSAK